MKKYFSISIISAILLILGTTACIKDDYWDKLEEELKILEQYLIDHELEIFPSYSGLYFIDHNPGSEIAPAVGDFVKMNYAGRTLAGERVFITSSEDTAIQHDIYDPNRLYGPATVQYGYFTPRGVNEGIGYMTEWGEATLIFPSTLGFGSESQGDIPPFSSLIYDVELLKVFSDPAEYEKEEINAYLEANEYTAVKDEVGLYYVQLEEGTGDFPSAGSTVDVLYDARLIDGRLLASTDTIAKSIKMDEFSVIFGLIRGIRKMKAGGKAVIVVPFSLGFGSTTVYDTTYGYKVPIPPYSTIVYDIELKNIR